MDHNFAFNTAIAAVMELVNEIYRGRDSAPAADVRFAIATAGSLVFPFAPHLGSEVYERLTRRRVWEEPWPEADPRLLVTDEIQLVIQLNGKLIDRLSAPANASEEELEEIARGSERLECPPERQADRQGRGRTRPSGQLRGEMSARQGPIQVPVGPLVGALGGVILLVALFLDWYDGLTGFTVFEFVDIVLVVCAVLIILQLAGGMGLLQPPLSPGLSLLVALFAVLVVLTQVVNDPPAVAGGNGPDQAIGIWLAVGGSALMVAGAVLATAHISLAVEPRDPAAEQAGRDDTGSEAATERVRGRRERTEAPDTDAGTPASWQRGPAASPSADEPGTSQGARRSPPKRAKAGSSKRAKPASSPDPDPESGPGTEQP